MYNINLKSYVKAELGELAKANFVNLKEGMLDALADSVLFDWNEIGDPKEDLNDVIEWNLEQHLIHA